MRSLSYILLISLFIACGQSKNWTKKRFGYFEKQDVSNRDEKLALTILSDSIEDSINSLSTILSHSKEDVCVVKITENPTRNKSSKYVYSKSVHLFNSPADTIGPDLESFETEKNVSKKNKTEPNFNTGAIVMTGLLFIIVLGYAIITLSEVSLLIGSSGFLSIFVGGIALIIALILFILLMRLIKKGLKRKRANI